ncbi:DNA repair protein RecO [Pseudoalteromonas ruthenica]|uniref:DNA repair protein RecO n=1 Tax=Pseudoalteromonas ruthenica TaxID=151081 RepID=A0A5S3Z6J3_9GAMM|nr:MULTISPECIES: DNA repair protein RecO [Pseudoalteromonas]MCG7570909.1 DNA repair protein RecO [Pseudoalteromonas sp. CNC9-20]RZF84846.1 DNA repair protein RecO [Pseudoalteromonas sp. CO325X]TMO43756.1 DNA repair protein RecO [Pseudoalteromonas ruthenica]TMO51775.1 DNA repair protein RecO [Pseudoalteromonas ruthenica]TMP87862.1 DNA repair protein RecO [Pseudoalteromonas ruthenica]|tara:strand:+ start:19444 stop:20139 length:696 start_codon:yes stop_codon:yes gene_type:complete
MEAGFDRAFLLHRRAISDSQWLADFLVQHRGMMRMIVRLSGKHAVKHKAQLQPFQPLLIRYQGGGDLKYLQHFELSGSQPALIGDKLYCGFYMNELAVRIVPLNEPLEQVYDLYQAQLKALAATNHMAASLRHYELTLLESLGYGVDFEYDNIGKEISADCHYDYYPEQGWVMQQQPKYGYGFSGKQVLAMAAREFTDPEIQQAAKHFCRFLLKPLLGNKPLKSRELFKSR